MIRLRSGWATDPGRVRSSNQDRVLVIDGRVFAVADGMGGHKGGEVAAQIVVDQLRSLAPGTQTTVSGASAGTGTGDDDDPDTAVLEMPLVLDHRRDPMDPGLTASDASPEPELESGREAGTNEDPPTLTTPFGPTITPLGLTR